MSFESILFQKGRYEHVWNWIKRSRNRFRHCQYACICQRKRNRFARAFCRCATKDTKQIVAVGNEAKQMIGRTPGNVVALRPMKDGVIADYETTAIMMKYYIKQATKNSGLFAGKPYVMVCVPSGITAVEERAVIDATRQAGARDAYTIEEPFAAAIGANLPVWEPTGSMVVDIGGGTTEVAVISLGGIVTSQSIRVAGDEMDEAIIQYIRKTYNLMIGERTAEAIKVEIGSAGNPEGIGSMEIRGRDLLTGLPKTIEIHAEEIAEALRDTVYAIVDSVKIRLKNAARTCCRYYGSWNCVNGWRSVVAQFR